jgi:hypothetical protein
VPRKADPSLHRVCLTLQQPEYSRLSDLYPNEGVSAVVRALIKNHLNKIEQKTSAMNDLVVEIDLELEEPEIV